MSDAPDPEERGRLEDRLRSLYAWLEEHGEGSEDPEAPARVAEIRSREAVALFYLGRHAESLEAADLAIALFRSREPEEIDEWEFLQALVSRRATLDHLDRQAESDELDAEIILRFSNSANPKILASVARALRRRAANLLIAADTFQRGIELDDQLIALLAAEPEDNLLAIAEICVQHAEWLTSRVDTSLGGALTFPAQVLIANGTTAARAVTRRLPRPLRRPLGAVAVLEPVWKRLAPARLGNLADRAREAQRLDAAVLSRLYRMDDQAVEALARRAEFNASASLFVLGDFAGAGRIQEGQLERGDPELVSTYDWWLKRVDLTTTWAQLGSIGLLAHRSRALGGGDPALTRATYDESVTELLGAAPAWIVRLTARALRPDP